MNAVKLIGNVGKEVVTREFEGGKVATFSVATNETYLNRNKEEVTNTTWHNVVAWGKLAQVCEQLLSKGKLVAIEGRLNYRQYQNKEDQTVKVVEVVATKIEEVGKKAE
jgi:single-strand DNA-binding protein